MTQTRFQMTICFQTLCSSSIHAALIKLAPTSTWIMYAITSPLKFALCSVCTHLKSVQFTFVHIYLYFDLHVYLAASDHYYIISMHFIKLYKGNVPVFLTAVIPTTKQTNKKNQPETLTAFFSSYTSFI